MQFWVDELFDKHECGTLPMRIESITVGESQLTLLVPEYAVQFEVYEAHQHGDRLFLILKDLTTEGWEDHLGIIALANRQGDGRYAVVLWHATYPYIWKHL